MTTETITLTLRGTSYSREIPTAAVDLMLAAFADQYRDRHWPRDEAGELVEMPAAEFYALCLRKHSIEVASGYAAKLDDAITPNRDAVAGLISAVEG